MWRSELHFPEEQTSALVTAAGRMAQLGLKGFAFFDTALPADAGGPFATARWSFLTADPFGLFRVRDGRGFWQAFGGADSKETPLADPPLMALRRLLDQYQLAPDADDPTPFRGGCAGYIAYDFAWRLERLAPLPQDFGANEITLGFHDVVVALDHYTGRVVIYSSGFPAEGGQRAARAAARGAWMRQLLLEAAPEASASETRLAQAEPAAGSGDTRTDAGSHASNHASDQSLSMDAWRFDASHDRAQWVAAVRRVQDYIRAGDIFQANIARRFSAAVPASFNAFDFYRVLRRENPAPFAAYMDFGDLALASSSPERFVTLRAGAVETRPIKGTARRSPDPAQDAAAAAALLASDKDRAENVMIVDLLRNDLSRVCAPGTVQVGALCALESYANVHHLVSAVSGRLAEGRDAVDLISATFPGGSITGAPKIRAMDVITEIEGAARGVYCGAIGYLGFDGCLDFNIAIRTVSFCKGEAVFQAGGGITLLSDPEAEFVETEDKAARLFSAFARYARGG